jgi:hypothetical protein
VAAKRCPICHLVNRRTATSCDCGYEFGADSPDLQGMLTHKLTLGWVHAVSGVLLVLVGVALLLGGLPTALWFWIGGGLIAARGMRKISQARQSLRATAKAKLPPAQVVR